MVQDCLQRAWLWALPRSRETSSPGHLLDDVGPGEEHVLLFSTPTGTSVFVGRYTAPPAHLPRITSTPGVRPDSSSPMLGHLAVPGEGNPASLDAGAASESLMPTIGSRVAGPFH